MKFSVVTITKDNPDGFRKTKQSVESQRYSDFEWVVVDGNKEPDNGIYDAMNKGIDRACGDYIIFMNAGDQFAHENVLGDIAKYDADFIYGGYIRDDIVYKAGPIYRLKYGMVTSHQSMVYRADILKTMRYDERYKLASDYNLTLQFVNLSNCILYINNVFSIFESGGVSEQNASQSRLEEQAIRRSFGIHAPLTPMRQYCAFLLKKHCAPLYYKIRSLL